MIDRSYLPFKSAREHQDRGMMKWMGFFLSEHTTSLAKDANHIDIAPRLDEGEKHVLLGQLYANQMEVDFFLRGEEGMYIVSGSISSFSTDELCIKHREGYSFIRISDIVDISLSEEELDD